MAPIVNPCLQEHYQTKYIRQTFEIRSPDGSAFIHLLLSGITHAILTTFSNPEKYLHIAESHYVEPGDTGPTDSFESLPGTCQEAAKYLQAARDRYRSAFPEEVLDWVIRYLQSHEDGRLQEELKQLSPGEQVIRRLEIMHHYFHIQ
jgi:glutamine synthetase